ncbi:GSCFA domain-containing protein [Flavobacterium sp. J49]|uniref:GSCFA domain-containing protein n=1 Tax=Flavobacterium sp. J49 TaxID=2718534 RepID=UPI0015941EA8|nr:GSCFA domain-containing protein [Flavobacterium sp. J49]MBF6640505.1 GSCFA domain-containing protein [Flavobacterium sp. J49]NIC01752.1 GSCFA domain-containing protein [Flavobacterium sp. J49]
MNFNTKVPVACYEYPIDYNVKLLALGSCFAENMGDKFHYYKFQMTTNPFGIIFNPVSIEKLVNRIVNQRMFTESDVFYHNDLWHCYEVHSELSHADKEVFLERLNLIIQQSNNLILQASHVIVTYGTSWVYRLNSTNEIVANCHKIPQKEFAKEILSPEIIQQSIQNTIALIQKVNPDCRFIFTISPVRHIKDGFTENQRSKAHLISALHKLLNTEHFALNTNYFPSYEIMMDELRDYRFYAEDMLHPSQIAIDYIWTRFLEHYVAPKCFETMQEVANIQKALAHRPFNPDTASHQQFLATLNQKIIRLQAEFPHFQF